MSIGRWPGPRQGAANWLLSSQEGKGRTAVPQGASGQSSRWPETQERPGQPPCSSALGGGPCGAGEAGRSWQLPRAQKILALLSSSSLNWKDHISPGPTLWAVQVHPSKARWWWGGCSLTSCAFPAWARGPGGRAGLSAALAGRLFPEGAAPGPVGWEPAHTRLLTFQRRPCHSPGDPAVTGASAWVAARLPPLLPASGHGDRCQQRAPSSRVASSETLPSHRSRRRLGAGRAEGSQQGAGRSRAERGEGHRAAQKGEEKVSGKAVTRRGLG